MNYYISDLHLFCKSELRNGYFKERPFDTLEEMHETLKNGETYMMDGKLYMNQRTYTQLKTSIEFENLLKGR